jgi:hypothetical protein
LNSKKIKFQNFPIFGGSKKEKLCLFSKTMGAKKTHVFPIENWSGDLPGLEFSLFKKNI